MTTGRDHRDQQRDGQNRFKRHPPSRAFRLWVDRTKPDQSKKQEPKK